MKTFFTVLFITAAVVILVCIIFRGETPDKPKKNIKSDNPAILPYGKTGVLAHRSGAGLAPENTLLAFQNMIKNSSPSINITIEKMEVRDDGDIDKVAEALAKKLEEAEDNK